MPSHRVIFLSAGIGERLRPWTYDSHKCLLKIRGKALVEHWLDALIYSGAEIDRVHIIIGHCGYKFRNLLGSNYRGLKIQFLANPLYRITGAAQSLYAASNILRKHSCIVLEGDHYMDPKLMKILMQCKYENCILVDSTSELKMDEETLAYGYEGNLQKLKWLPPYPEKPLGEALTIFKISKEVANALAVVLEDYLLEDGPAKREIIEPFNRLMRMFDFHYVDTGGREWTEIDFETDLEKAKTFKFEHKRGEK